LNFALPPTATDQPPAFLDAAQCRAWLEGQPQANAVQVQAQLLRQINLLNRYTLPATERLAILELLRQPITACQDESTRKFAGRPLPLSPPEQAAFDSNRALWHGLASGYLRCLEACLAGDASVRPRTALIIERALAALLAVQADTYRGSHAPDGSHWQVVHELYGTAEQLDVAEQVVEDSLRLGRNPTNPRAAYVEALLLAAASPHELTARQFVWMARWARRWAAKVRVLASPPTLSTRAIPLCVDLGSDRPAAYRPLSGDYVRWLETAELRQSLKKRLILIEQGQPPAALHLGDDCAQPACGQLLKHVYQRWCKGGAIRRHDRHLASGNCDFILGIEAIHYYLSGRKPFKQPGHASMDTLRQEREEIATFGRVASRRQADFSKQQGYQIESWDVVEEWQMLDESATGLHVARPSGQQGGRVGATQLIAVRPGDAKTPLLGCTRWVTAGGDGTTMHAGVQIFPGLPEAVASRGTGLAAVNEPYRQAFLLPAVPALKEPATAIIPAGWFKLDRVLEVLTDSARQIRLKHLVDHGIDFDRVSYEPIP
jgi:hypothetical protein